MPDTNMLDLTLKFRQNTFNWQVKNITQICLQRKVDLARSIQRKMNLLYETFSLDYELLEDRSMTNFTLRC